MTTAPLNAEQIKQNLLRQWNAVAPAWQQWWDIWQSATQPISERLVALAGVQPGHRVLDIATGLGEPALTAAQRVGATGRVVATDFSPGMLNKARERAAAVGVANVDFYRLDAESLDLPGELFDAVVSRWGITELPNLALALQKIEQQLASGGSLAVAVWSSPAAVPFIGIPVAILRQRFAVPPPAPGTPSPFSLGDQAKLAAVLTQAGFADVQVETQPVTFLFPSFGIYRTFLEDVVPVVRGVLGNQPADQQAAAWQAIAEAVQPFVQADGTLQIPNSTICATGKR